MKKIIIAVAAMLFAATFTSRADEGMWMVNAIDKALEKKMQARGLGLSAKEIYDNSDVRNSLCGAIVSMDFGCTGSIISDEGLLITNHHCAYEDVFKLSTDECNYLEDGFFAAFRDKEISIKGKKIQLLKKVIDVTDEVEKMQRDSLGDIASRPMGMRKLSFIVEKKYTEETGYEASLSSMWGGSKYYVALYEEYSDIRLVAAPPVSIAAFGGDVDNWEWPQHKCDFALYRIYTAPDGSPAEYSPENVPLKPSRRLRISTSGYEDGDFTMVIGYPGRTSRYSSSAKVDYLTNKSLPVSNKIRKDQMGIISKWMDADPSVRLKYSDHFFSLSNVQELYEGEVQCCHRFKVSDAIRQREKGMQKWISKNPKRIEKWGTLLEDLDKVYSDIEDVDRNTNYYRESLVRGCTLGLICTRVQSFARSKKNANIETLRSSVRRDYAGADMRVEKDRFFYSVRTFYENVDSTFWGPYQKELYASFGGDCDEISKYLWQNSWTPDLEKVEQLLSCDVETARTFADDVMVKFYKDISIASFNHKLSEIQGSKTATALSREYTHALYQMRKDKKIVQYPDANSTMRITYGVVGGYEPHDAVWCDFRSAPRGILEKYDPEVHDFSLKPDWKEMLEKVAPQSKNEGELYVDFLTDNDITGGNSGSPVMNSRGELIGLAFDGNKESLASDFSFTEFYNKCVCVDIRFVIWTLKNYAHMDVVLDEIFR